LVFLAVLAVAGGVLAATWPKITPILFPPDEATSPDKNIAAVTNVPLDPPQTTAKAARPAGPTSLKGSPTTVKAAGPKRGPIVGGNPANTPRDVNPFPRRALVISVHNYLYANPVGFGALGPGARNMNTLLEALSGAGEAAGFKIPRNQIFLLSDLADKGRARPPMKSVIAQTLTSFLDSSRAQDRIMVIFTGRAIEIGDQAFLVPIEGELENSATLIPFKWVYNQLLSCKARQKVLLLDVSRFSPTRGMERPDGGPLGAKFEAALKNPPSGVQVWSACSRGQRSYATDDKPMGVFLDSLFTACKEGIANRIQRYEDLLPVEQYCEKVNALMATELGPRKLEQVSFLSGQDAENGSVADRSERPPTSLTLPPAPVAKAAEKLVKNVLAEVGTPAVKPSHETDNMKYEALPPFKPEVLAKYDSEGEEGSPFHKAVHNARVVLWAVSHGRGEPAELQADVARVRGMLKNANLDVVLDVLERGIRARGPAQENQLKMEILEFERNVARIMGRLNEALEDMKAVAQMRDSEPLRWQANYDFTLARLEAQIAFLYEFQSMLGQMRKEFPPRDPKLHGGWRLAAAPNLQGDSAGKKLAKDSRKILEKIAKDHAGTPWEVLAKREKLTALGLEWQPTR
jgi:hypothetical protein